MGGFTAKQQKTMRSERQAGIKKSIAAGGTGLLAMTPHPDPTKRAERKKVGGKYVRSKSIWTGHKSDPLKLKSDERYETRPERLLRARKTYEKNTGRKAKAVKTALLYKDFTDLEKKEYKTLLG